MTSLDPTTVPGRWDSLHAVLRRLDDEIETVYADRGIVGAVSYTHQTLPTTPYV